MPTKAFQTKLAKYADLIVTVGLNLERGQRLIIYNAATRGVGVHTLPLVSEIARAAYQAGSPLVDVIWNDESLIRTRLEHIRHADVQEYPTWHTKGLLDTIEGGGALLSIHSSDPDLLADLDPELAGLWNQRHVRDYEPVLVGATVNRMNWCVVAAAGPRWAKKVYPRLSSEKAEAKLWRTLFRITRADLPDPVAAWTDHIRELTRRARYLTDRRFTTLRYTGPGTDLTIGLPDGHRWLAAREQTASGHEFTANLPTEEVFTLPHRLRTEGRVQATLPLVHAGQRIEGLNLSFQGGHVVRAEARKGEAVLRKLISLDEGASFLGEVALVPQDSPVARQKTLFFDSLLDENAACHVAIGRGYRTCLPGSERVTDAEFLERGGNIGSTHVDFMIGSSQLDIDGIERGGAVQPVMRAGEWAFDI